MKVKLSGILYLLGATISLMIPAFINGYPIVYSDTSTYLASGFNLTPPVDRPITYGLFIRLFSINGLSLWIVIGIQSMILAWLMFRLLKELLLQFENPQLLSFLIIVSLALFTGVSWNTSQLMPDIFTAIMVLTAIILLMANTTRGERFFLYFIFFLSTAMHMSHVIFCIAYFTGILILRELNLFQLKRALSIRPVLIMIGLSLLSIVTMSSAFSKSKHVFLMGAMVEHGITGKYLNKYCGTHPYQLCEYKDQLPEKAWQFIWDESSPFYKIGGWKGTKEEFNEIIWNTLKSPEFLALHVKESLKATLDQLIRFKIGDGNGIFLRGTLLHERIEKYFAHELSSYERSRQNQGKLSFTGWFNIIQTIVVIVSVLGIMWGLLIKCRRLNSIIILAIWGIIINAWVCGTFANAIDRLGSKMIWIIPFLALTCLIIRAKNSQFMPEAT